MIHREKRTIYIIFAIAIALIAPIIVIFTPFTVGMIFYDNADKIVFIPSPSSLGVYASAFIAASASLVIIYFLQKRILKIAVGILAIVAFLFLFVSGTKSYIYIDKEFIESSHGLKGQKQYTWEEITQLDLTKKTVGREREDHIIFIFNDQYKLSILVDGVVNYHVEGQIVERAQKFNIPVNQIIVND
ncbi:hypothetical protein [Bacillus ndiopicus]|uniref:hypothetical protein n=1 Tax=Bacillus ndiopicus TaxID=1347368 RepID=UPI0005A8735F|nr:hypothetical protein [Bacillus ndiopicus]